MPVSMLSTSLITEPKRYGRFNALDVEYGHDFSLISSQSFSGASTVSFDNVFSSNYDHYMVLRNVQGSLADEQIVSRLRSGGVDNTSTLYAHQLTGRDGTSSIAQRSVSDRMQAALGYTETGKYGSAWCYILSPYITNRTGFIYMHGYQYPSSVRIYHWQGCHDSSQSFDGVTFYPSSGTITGEIYIYGLRS